jgi:phospholipid/cholesterol/gamma-HCH transport system permease protein
MTTISAANDPGHFQYPSVHLILEDMAASNWSVQGFMGALRKFLLEIGDMSLFAGRFFREAFHRPFEFRELLRQCYHMGNRSLVLVGVTGFIIGLVLTLQSRPTLIEFGAVSWMPNMVGISIVRELGPVITALVCAGRIASGIGAELGSMKAFEIKPDLVSGIATNTLAGIQMIRKLCGVTALNLIDATNTEELRKILVEKTKLPLVSG